MTLSIMSEITARPSYIISQLGRIAESYLFVSRAATNQGVLGAHCNALMLCKAIYGRLPEQLPASLEAVIDGSVKTGLDLTPVKKWNQTSITRMVKHGQSNASRTLPGALLDRLPAWLREQAQAAESHWLDMLTNALELHKAQLGFPFYIGCTAFLE